MSLTPFSLFAPFFLQYYEIAGSFVMSYVELTQ